MKLDQYIQGFMMGATTAWAVTLPVVLPCSNVAAEPAAKLPSRNAVKRILRAVLLGESVRSELLACLPGTARGRKTGRVLHG